MPYLNMDDNFADHPKVDALSDGAFRLHVAGLLYCARHTTDGIIPAHRVARLTRTYKPTQLAELLRSGIWLKHPSHYEVHDYLDWNKSSAWWAEKRSADAARQAEYRARRAAEKAAEEAARRAGRTTPIGLVSGGVTP